MDEVDGPTADARSGPGTDDEQRRNRDRAGGRRDGRRSAGAPWNPHVVVLVLGGLVLVTIGVRLYRSALDVVYSDFTNRGTHGLSGGDSGDGDVAGDLVAMQVEWTIGPLLIAAGILAVLVGVTVLAVRWRREPGR